MSSPETPDTPSPSTQESTDPGVPASDQASADPTPAPAPRPRPTPPPRRPVPAPPGGRAPASAPVPSLPAPAEPSQTEMDARAFGRVTEDGTVLVRTPDGERTVGQVPDTTPEEALAFFTRRYADLVVEVELLERRVAGAALPPDEAVGALKKVRAAVHEAQAVGDLAGLEARLEALKPLVEEQREARRVERARKQEAARIEKERVVEEAERLGQGDDWRNGANRLRQLLEDWKVLPRLEKSVDDTLWRRFSTARTTYTRRRKAHFSEVNEQRDTARAAKERLVVEAEALSASTEWGPTAGRYRDLMTQWKAAGPAAKEVDDQLWKRFRTAQDTFFGARDATNAEVDREFAANAVVKEQILTEAEALLPVTDLRTAKEAFRRLADRWDDAGKVPRERIKDLEARMRVVEQAIRGREDDQWRRSNPEAAARAADTVAQLEASLADLERKRAAAEAAGNARKVAEHASAIEARQSWLTEARRAMEEFSA